MQVSESVMLFAIFFAESAPEKPRSEERPSRQAHSALAAAHTDYFCSAMQ